MIAHQWWRSCSPVCHVAEISKAELMWYLYINRLVLKVICSGLKQWPSFRPWKRHCLRQTFLFIFWEIVLWLVHLTVCFLYLVFPVWSFHLSYSSAIWRKYLTFRKQCLYVRTDHMWGKRNYTRIKLAYYIYLSRNSIYCHTITLYVLLTFRFDTIFFQKLF